MLTTKRLFIFIFAGFIFATLSFYALNSLSEDARHFNLANKKHTSLLLITGLGLAALSILSLWQILKLIRDLRKKAGGAKLSLSFTFALFASSIIPLAISAYFSTIFLSFDLDNAFNGRVNQALDDSLKLTRAGISLRASEALQRNRNISLAIASMNHLMLLQNIEALRRENDAISIAVFDEKGIVIASAHKNLEVIHVEAPSALAISRANETQEYFEYSELDSDYRITVLSRMQRSNGELYYLQSAFNMPSAFNTLANKVSYSAKAQQSYRHLRPHVQNNIFFALTLVFLLAVLISLWLSLLFARYMSSPIGSLIQATQNIGDGNYSLKIKEIPHSELGELAHHFNSMSNKLQSYYSDLQAQKNYLENIMNNISSGVLVFNNQRLLSSFNQAALKILNTENIGNSQVLQEFISALGDKFAQSSAHWQQEITLNQFSVRKNIMCHGSAYEFGLIIVFDDITDFLHNQKNEAWEKVAQRLAHEIKNPLTPIQLQAERLQRKIGTQLEENEAQILQRATSTIINQVEVMKRLVADFGQIARPLKLRIQALQLKPLLLEISDLYQQQIELDFLIPEQITTIFADPLELRQVFNNLVKNAIEAGATKLQLKLTEQDNNLQFILQDNGQGFPNLNLDPFEPYVTNKEKGSGLGLAIVRKIINEHGGNITAGNAQNDSGAQIIFTLPMVRDLL